MKPRRTTGLGSRLGLGASLLVAVTAMAVAWGVVAVVAADLHRDLELRSGAVARGLARGAIEPLQREDRAKLERLLGEVWDVDDLARVEVRNLAGTIVAVRAFPAGAEGDEAVVVAPVTGEADAEGFRDTLGSIHVVLSGAGNQARRLRYLEMALRVALVAIAVGVVLASALAWALSRPLRRLQQAASALAAGHAAHALPITGPREVRALGIVVAEAIAAVAAREAELKDAYDRLQRTEEAREAMTHMLVHDLKGPLSNVLMLLEVLGADAGPDDQPLLEEGRLRCRGLLELIQDLLAMSRIEAGHIDLDRVAVDVAALVEEALAQVDHLVRQRRFVLERGPLLGRVLCDQRLIQRVLVNLVLNAVRHGRSPARIEARLEGPEVVLVVEDSGPGVPPDRIERVFEKFHSGAATRGGAGLGLAFVRLVARAHGGEASVQGARFEVRLPTGEEAT